MQSSNKQHGFAKNLPLQFGLGLALLVILIALSWAYLW
jgi:hypothetical protein